MTTAIDGMCRASDLRYLVNTKQFTMIPSHLLRYLQMEAGISLDEFGMWVAIYDLVSADPELQRPITWKFLAARFGFSEKTAKRICTRLVDKRLLVIESRHREDGSQLPSLFKIRVANKVAARLLTETPDRAKPILESGDEQSKPELKPEQSTTAPSKNPETQKSFKPEQKHARKPSARRVKSSGFEIPNPGNETTAPTLKTDARASGYVNVRELMRKLSSEMKQEEASVLRADASKPSVDVTEHTVDVSSPGVDVSQDCVDGKWECVDGSLQYVDGVGDRVDEILQGVNASITPVKMSQREANSVNGQILLIGASMKKSALAERLEAARKRSDFTQEKRSEEKRPDVAGQPENVSERKIEAGQNVAREGVDKSVGGEGVRNDHQEKTSSEGKTNNNSLTKQIARKLTELGLKFERVVALTCEVQASIERGSLKKFSLNHALNIAAKLIRTGRWTAPRLAYR